jgi:glycosyltransferase involved in cell wall biosynthesis
MIKKIPILYLHNISQISGGERSLLNLFEHLDRNRFVPYLIVPSKGELSQEAERLGVNVSFYEIPKLSPVHIFKIFRTVSEISKFVDDQKIRIIHSYAPRNNLVSAYVAKRKKIISIWHERNLTVTGEKDISKMFLSWPHAVICNSKAVALRFADNHNIPKKVYVVLNGVNLNYFEPVAETQIFKKELGLSNVLTVGMVANLNKRKRIEFFIELAAQVHEHFKNIKFLVIGGEFPDCGGKRIQELKTLSKRLGIEEQVIFTGYQSDIRKYLYALDVFVHVTIKEACSRAILEAMASAKAVVAVNDGGNPELIENQKTGLLFDCHDQKGFTSAIVELLNDEGKRRLYGLNAHKRVETFFDVRRNAKETQDIYEQYINV